MARASHFYQVGGTLLPNVPSYIERAADAELLKHIRLGEFCYVLTTRQMGKSSLMVRTARRLKAEGTLAAIVDLTGIGSDKQSITPEQWYYGVADEILGKLGLDVKLDAWWEERAGLSPVQRMVRLLREVVLANTSGRVVVFVDEIDSTLSLPFASDFFAAIRACYNARAEDPAFARLTFVLLGVASPSDLISDPTRTPFNVGTRIDLTDFTIQEALPLVEGLHSDESIGKDTLRRILYWTGGHPYLTQKVCLRAAESARESVKPDDIDRIVKQEFLAAGSERRDDNLNFVRNRVEGRGDLTPQMLDAYKRIFDGREVKDDPTSPVLSELKLAGLVKVGNNGNCAIRNEIYKRVFGKRWIARHTPRASVARYVATIAIMLLTMSPFAYYEVVYPFGLMATIGTAKAEEDNLARQAYNSLRAVPLRRSEAEDLWRKYNVKRAEWAIELDDQQPNRRVDAFRVATLAHAELAAFPASAARARELLARFCERRAIRWAYGEHRDEAILWWLETLKADPSRDEFRRVVNQFIEPDYARLVKTIRTGMKPKEVRESVETIDSTNLVGVSGSAPSFQLLSANGRRLAAGTSDGNVRVWELDRPDDEPLTFRGFGGKAHIPAFSPDGKKLAAGFGGGRLGGDMAVRLLRVDQPDAEPVILTGHQGLIKALTFSADSTRLVTAGSDGTVRIWQVEKLDAAPVVIPGNSVPIAHVAISSGGANLLTVRADSTVQLWRVDGPTPTVRQINDKLQPNSTVAFSPDGTFFVYVGNDETARLRRVAQPDGDPLIFRSSAPINSVAFSPDSKLLLTREEFSVTQKLWSIDRPTDQPVEFLGDQLSGTTVIMPGVGQVVFSADSKRLVAVNRFARGARVWQVDHPKAEPVMIPSPDPIDSLAFSPDGSQLTFVANEGTARLWKLGQLAAKPALLSGRKGAISALSLSPDGSRLITFDLSKDTAWLWRVDEPSAEPVYLGVSDRKTRAIAFNRDGSRLALGARDGMAMIWRVDQPTASPVILRHNQAIADLAFNHDGTRLAAVDAGPDVTVWKLDLPTADPVVLGPTTDGVRFSTVAFSPEGDRVVAAGSDGVRLWRLDQTKVDPIALKSRNLSITRVEFSPDGKYLVAVGLFFGGGANQNTFSPIVAVWRLDQPTVDPFVIGTAGPQDIRDATFSPDGDAIFIAKARWVHLARWDGSRLSPLASRPLPGFFLGNSRRAFRFLDPSGEQVQIVTLPTADTFRLTTVRFDAAAGAPIDGDPDSLIQEWQRRLSLEINANGEVVPGN